MWRTLILGTLFAAVLVNPLRARAQDKIGPNALGPTYPGEITYQWDYSCPSGGEVHLRDWRSKPRNEVGHLLGGCAGRDRPEKFHLVLRVYYARASAR